MKEEMKEEMIDLLKEIARGEHENDEMRVCTDLLRDHDIDIEDTEE